MCDKNILIVIDFWSDWTYFRHSKYSNFYISEDYAKYIQNIKKNCLNIINFFKKKKLKIIKKNYFKKK